MDSTAKAIIDTQVFLWMASSPERIPVVTRELCQRAELVLSVASVWEIAIKHHAGKLPLSRPINLFLDANIRAGAVSILPIHYRHALRAAALPGSHKDPFDRMIAAQSLEERLPCISADAALDQFAVSRIW